MSFFDQENNGAECFFDQENNGAECFFDTQKSPEPGPVPGKFWPVPYTLKLLEEHASMECFIHFRPKNEWNILKIRKTIKMICCLIFEI